MNAQLQWCILPSPSPSALSVAVTITPAEVCTSERTYSQSYGLILIVHDYNLLYIALPVDLHTTIDNKQ